MYRLIQVEEHMLTVRLVLSLTLWANKTPESQQKCEMLRFVNKCKKMEDLNRNRVSAQDKWNYSHKLYALNANIIIILVFSCL